MPMAMGTAIAKAKTELSTVTCNRPRDAEPQVLRVGGDEL